MTEEDRIPLVEHHSMPMGDDSHERSPQCWCKPSKIIEGFHIFYEHNRPGVTKDEE